MRRRDTVGGRVAAAAIPHPGVKLLDARFVTSAADASAIPADGIPHIAFVGRSNVGKSSVINALAGATLARTSAAPGKTRLANLYRFTVEGGPGGPGRWSVYLADLPGYGYARGGEQSVAELRQIAESYFSAASAPRAGRAAEETRDRDSVARKPGSPDAGERRTAEAGRLARNAGSPNLPYRIAGVLLLADSRHPGLELDIEAAEWLSSLAIERAVVATKIDKLSRAERAKNLKALENTLGSAALPVSAVSGEGLDDLWRLIAGLSRRP